MLAVAYSVVTEQEVYKASDERDLALAGFLTFSDPPLESAKLALIALKRDGVQVKILTGDNELVTQHICSEVGIEDDTDRGSSLWLKLHTRFLKLADSRTVHRRR
jgi:Mg2+-importing ATPase